MIEQTTESVREQAYQAFAEGNLKVAHEMLAYLYRHQAGSEARTANDLAVVLLRLGRWQESVEKFREAVRLSGEEASLLVANLIDALTGVVNSGGGIPQDGSLKALASGADLMPGDSLSRWINDSASALHAELAKLNDIEWIKVLNDSLSGRPYNGHYLPGYISEESQRLFVGSAGATALHEAARFVRVLLEQLSRHGRPLDDTSVVVDFGSGWGRYTRFMLRHVHPDNLYGLEVNGGMVEHCRKAFGMANFLKVGTMPPSPLRDRLVDVAFGYSVFSHLSPDCADAWIGEFARIVKPGGLVLMTTQRRAFIEFCQSIRERGDTSHPWFVSLANSFVDVDACYAEYDAGGFLHAGCGQLGGTYGESLISCRYIEQNWSEKFELVDFVDDQRLLPQALFVLRRRG